MFFLGKKPGTLLDDKLFSWQRLACYTLLIRWNVSAIIRKSNVDLFSDSQLLGFTSLTMPIEGVPHPIEFRRFVACK
jgi:hypothetical protein